MKTAVLWGGSDLWALTSAVGLPGGVRAAAFVYGVGKDIAHQFTPDGRLKDLAEPLNKSATIDDLLPFDKDLQTLKTVLLSVYPDDLSGKLIGINVFSQIHVTEKRYMPALLYGITDHLMLAAMLPVIRRNYDATFRAEMINQGVELEKLLGGAPHLPDAARQLAEANIDEETIATEVFQAHGYQTPRSFTAGGLGDLELEARYHYLDLSWLDLAARLRLNIPTSNHEVEISNLLDRPLGKGNYSLGLGAYQAVNLFTPALVFNSAFRWTYNFPSTQLMAVPRDKDALLPNLNDGDYENVRRARGWDFMGDLALSWNLRGGFISLAASYIYLKSQKSRHSGSKDLYYAFLGQDTDTEEHALEASVEVSTIPLFQDDVFPVPGKFVLAWYQPVAGKNAIFTPYLRMDFAMLF